MIKNDEQLGVVLRQLAIVEEILESWRKQLMPHNPRNFALYSEGCVDEIEILKAEIDEYLARAKAKLPDPTATPTTPGRSANVS